MNCPYKLSVLQFYDFGIQNYKFVLDLKTNNFVLDSELKTNIY
jgi:hypothetical protein